MAKFFRRLRNPVSLLVSRSFSKNPKTPLTEPQNPSLNILRDESNLYTKFLIKSCGFRKPEIETLAKRFNPYTNRKNLENINKSVQVFRDFGFTNPNIKTILTKSPSVVTYNAEYTMQKLQTLNEFGFSKEQIICIVTGNPRFLGASLRDKINPNFETLTDIFGSRTNTLKALMKCPTLLSSNMKSTVLPCIECLGSVGVNGARLRVLIVRRPQLLLFGVPKLLCKIEFVKEQGVSEQCKIFSLAVQILCHYDTGMAAEKMRSLQKLGFDAAEVRMMFSKYPHVITVSRSKIVRVLGFLAPREGFEVFVQCPMLFTYSLERNVRPRAEVVWLWKELEPSKKVWGISSVVKISEKKFLSYVEQSEHRGELLKVYDKAFLS